MLKWLGLLFFGFEHVLGEAGGAQEGQGAHCRQCHHEKEHAHPTVVPGDEADDGALDHGTEASRSVHKPCNIIVKL